jgi:NADPH:quinone reductase-like Zn-dependent oxidoreductase
MKAIVQDEYGEADVLRLEDIERPEPGPGQVLVRVRAAGVDPGVWHLMAGMPYMVRLGFGIRKPKLRTRGADVAGVVESVGPEVSGFAPGDEVFGEGIGTFAEFALVPAKSLAAKPSNVSFAEAAVVAISGTTALQGLRDSGGIQTGQHVLILGASGGVGSFAVQLAKAFGARVTAVASTAKLDFVRSLGADEVLDYTRADPTDGSRRFHLILDTGGNRSLRQVRKALAPNGTLVIVGGEGGGRILGGFDRAVFRAPIASLFSRQKLRGLLAMARAADLATLRELVEAGKVRPPLERTFPLDEAPEAIRYLHAGKVRGKVAVTVE